MPRFTLLLLLASAIGLTGCDQLGIETPAVLSAKRETEGKAVGGACRHAGRAIEDCYTLNKRADKAAVFAGWREMNDYMRENKLDAVLPQLTPAGKPAASEAHATEAEAAPAPAPAPAPKKAAKH